MAKIRRKVRKGRPVGTSGEAARPVRIAVATCIWQRPALTEIVLRHYRRMADQVAGVVDLRLICVGSEGEASRALAERAGWSYVEHANMPLGAKWNATLPGVRTADADAVLIVGSDDLVNAAVVRGYAEALKEGGRYLGLLDLYFLDQPTGRMLHWRGYTGQREGETAGLGRCIHRDYLEFVGWKLWRDELEFGLDRSMHERLAPLLTDAGRAPERRAFRCGERGMMALDVKTRTNMWRFEDVARSPDCVSVPSDAVLADHFEKTLVEELRRLTPDGRRLMGGERPQFRYAGTPRGEADALVRAGEEAFVRGALATAEQSFREALRWVPTHGDALNDLGVTMTRMGRTAEAQRAFLKALLLADDPSSAAINLASVELDAGRPDVALRYIQRAAQLGGDAQTLRRAAEQIQAQLNEAQAK